MDQNSATFDQKKKIVEKQIAEALLDAVPEKIEFNDLQSISKEILVEFEAVDNLDQLIHFLEKISQKWPFFSNLLTIYKSETNTAREKEIINKLSSYLKNQN